MNQDPAGLGEFGLIGRFRSRLKQRSPRVKLGIGDDCAVYSAPSGRYQIVTTDALVEGVHFDLSQTSAEQLGRKALAVSLSDIAAMGGTPSLALITLGIRKKLTVAFLDKFYSGLDRMCREYRVELAGGDTVRSPGPFFINLTVIGEAQKKRLFTRSGARPGDIVFVTGSPGESALGLTLLQSPRKRWAGPVRMRNRLVRRHLDPVPRLRESALLSAGGARVTSMIDLSDGLTADLRHLCEAGDVGALLEEDRLPLSRELRRVCIENRLDPLHFLLAGGEDYELLFTTPAKDAKKIYGQFEKAEAPVSQIGEIVSRPGRLVLARPGGKRENLWNLKGYDHFRPQGQ